MKKIVIFASGNGSNAENIVKFFDKSDFARVIRIFTNNPKAFVIKRCQNLNIPCTIFTKKDFYYSDKIFNFLSEIKPDLIVLAGFLWLVPENIINKFEGKIINIHPAILPKYGGKGMYGNNVHKAVLNNKEKFSGITVHVVNNEYDKGKIIFQKTCKIDPDDTVESLAEKIHKLEYEFYPIVIEKLLKNQI